MGERERERGVTWTVSVLGTTVVDYFLLESRNRGEFSTCGVLQAR